MVRSNGWAKFGIVKGGFDNVWSFKLAGTLSMQIHDASPLRASWRRYAHRANSLFYAWAKLGCTLFFYASLLTLHSLLPRADMEDSPWHGTLFHADSHSGNMRTLWVFLPLLGLKHARRRGIHTEQQDHEFMSTVQKERVTVQGWGLVADAIRSTTSTFALFADVRIIGLVGHPLDCDPWLNMHTTECYECVPLPFQCLDRDYDDIPTVDCIFLTILGHVTLRHNHEDVIIYTNGDLVFPASKLLAVLSFLYYHPDTNNQKDAVLVGQRRDTPLLDDKDHHVDESPDVDKSKLLEDGLLTADNFEQFFSQALATSVLHADFGVDYFVLSVRVLSSLMLTKSFPPFLVGRYRWDNALLASFILGEVAASSKERDRNVGIRTIDITSVLPVVHLGQHSASPDYFQAQLGAGYNNQVAQEHFGDSYMLGRIHNTDWILTEAFPVIHAQDIPSPVLKIVKRISKVDVDILQAFDRAYDNQHPPSSRKGHVPLYGTKSTERDPDGSSSNKPSYPILLLVTVLPRDVPYARLWMQYVHSQTARVEGTIAEVRDHFLFVTVDQDSYNELEAAFPGTVILEKDFAWPSPIFKWHTFTRLLRNRLTVGIMSARDIAVMSSCDPLLSLWQQMLSDECDAVLYYHSSNRSDDKTDTKDWTLYSIRPSSAGMIFWEEYQQDGQRNNDKKIEPRPSFARSQLKRSGDENVCVINLMPCAL